MLYGRKREMSKYEIIESKYRKGGSKMLKLGEIWLGIKEEKEKREIILI